MEIRKEITLILDDCWVNVVQKENGLFLVRIEGHKVGYARLERLQKKLSLLNFDTIIICSQK